MEKQTTVTIARLYLPEESHSVRRVQMDKVLRFLRNQLHVHGVTVLAGMTDPGDNHKPHYQTVGDILRRNPDPPAIIEFFYDSSPAIPIGRMLGEVVPDSHIVYWQATRETLN